MGKEGEESGGTFPWTAGAACLAGGKTSCDSTRALLADFSTSALQISKERCRLTEPIGARFLFVRAVGRRAWNSDHVDRHKVNIISIYLRRLSSVL